MSSTDYLGCNIETFEKHIEQQFTEGMSWENYGEQLIDHKIPLNTTNHHWKNLPSGCTAQIPQPMWASENMSKGCRYISGCLEQR